MRASHSIDVEPPGFLRIKLSGFFDIAAFTRFAADREAAFDRILTAPNQHVCLCDVSECTLQSREATMAFAQVLGEPKRRSRRVAFVVGDSPARMQVRRLVGDRPDCACFADIAQAEAWLFEEQRPPAPRAAPAAGIGAGGDHAVVRRYAPPAAGGGGSRHRPDQNPRASSPR